MQTPALKRACSRFDESSEAISGNSWFSRRRAIELDSFGVFSTPCFISSYFISPSERGKGHGKHALNPLSPFLFLSFFLGLSTTRQVASTKNFFCEAKKFLRASFQSAAYFILSSPFCFPLRVNKIIDTIRDLEAAKIRGLIDINSSSTIVSATSRDG